MSSGYHLCWPWKDSGSGQHDLVVILDYNPVPHCSHRTGSAIAALIESHPDVVSNSQVSFSSEWEYSPVIVPGQSEERDGASLVGESDSLALHLAQLVGDWSTWSAG